MRWVFVVRNSFGLGVGVVVRGDGPGVKVSQVRFRVLDVPEEFVGREGWWYLNEVDLTSELLLLVPFSGWGGCWVRGGEVEVRVVNGEVVIF